MDEAIFIDANIFLEIFLKDSKVEQCKKFLESLRDQNKQAVTSDFIIYTCLIQAQYNLKNPKLLKNAIVFFNSYENLKVVRPSFEDLYKTAEIIDNHRLDLDDSLVVACMKKNGIVKLASLDKHFDKITGIERIKF